MKKALSLSLALLLLLMLTACGGAGKSYDNAMSESITQSAPMMPTVAPSASAGSGWKDYSASMDAADTPMEAPEMLSSSAESPLANAKIIYTADMNLQTKEFDNASRALDGIVTSLGGYYESRSLYQGGSYRNLNCVIRIPAANFSTFLDQAGQIALVTNCNEYKKDISEVYYDNEARLAAQQAKLDRLLELLEKASTMEDIISLETAISDTELQIEYLTGSLRKYDSLVNFSTITLYLNEVYRLSNEETPALTFGQRLGSALNTGLDRGIEGIEDFIIDVARNWLSLLITGAFVAVAVVVVIRFRRKRKNSIPLTEDPPKD